MSGPPERAPLPHLDAHTARLVRVAALVGLGASRESFAAALGEVGRGGLSAEEAVATLVAVAPEVGLADVVASAPELAAALGYDLDAALELPDLGGTAGR